MRSRLILAGIVTLFVIHCLSLNFTQDDAFISYRYAENLTEGQGLVFNAGERVEGYTNFLWILLISLFSRFGPDIILVSKILGVVSGCFCLFLLHLISRLLLPAKDRLLALFPSFLLTASSAFAYWSISGLESPLFVMMILLSLYLYLTRPRLWLVTCALCALIRPEGVLITGVLLLHKLLIRRDGIGESALCLGGFVLLLLPFAAFKLWYYGDLLPNPFYAKTGLSLEYVKSGLEYFWLFLKHYGLWGLLYLFPLLLYRRLGARAHLLMLLAYLYTLYVILIGGDVLRAHRFFLPVMPLLYLLFCLSLQKLLAGLRAGTLMRAGMMAALLSASAVFFLLPYRWIRDTRAAEKRLVEGTRFVAGYLRGYYGEGFSVALTTIGSMSYRLGTGVEVIDMLGLTDRYISRHPERIDGITVTWKEKKYNSRYVLSRDPDFILFSTGYKPSAPAERALLLNSKFRQNYYVIPVFLPSGGFWPIFKRKGEYSKENEIFGDSRFVDLFYEGENFYTSGKVEQAIEKMKQAASLCPDDFALAYELLGQYYFNLGDHSAAKEFLKKAVEVDDYSVMSHFLLASIYETEGRLKEADAERNKVILYDPNSRW